MVVVSVMVTMSVASCCQGLVSVLVFVKVTYMVQKEDMYEENTKIFMK